MRILGTDIRIAGTKDMGQTMHDSKFQPSGKATGSRWLVLIAVGLIGYGLLQPVLNSRWGWSLPSLAALVGGSTEATEPAVEVTGPAVEVTASAAEVTESAEAFQPQPPTVSESEFSSSGGSPPELKVAAQPQSQNDGKLYGLLRELADDDFVSPAGLRYTRGSQEGHRLKHLARHLQDQPDRPGRHGVFQADMRQVLLWLDEAYQRGMQGKKGTKKRQEDGRTIIEATFAKPLGFIGGRDGKRQGHPPSKRLRMVLDEDRVITAFPF
jgi:hypothetical protein